MKTLAQITKCWWRIARNGNTLLGTKERPRNRWKWVSAGRSWWCWDEWVIVAQTSPCLTELPASGLWTPNHLCVWAGGYTVRRLQKQNKNTRTHNKKRVSRNKTLPGIPHRGVKSRSQIQDAHRFSSGKTKWKGRNLGLLHALEVVNRFFLVSIKTLQSISKPSSLC